MRIEHLPEETLLYSQAFETVSEFFSEKGKSRVQLVHAVLISIYLCGTTPCFAVSLLYAGESYDNACFVTDVENLKCIL